MPVVCSITLTPLQQDAAATNRREKMQALNTKTGDKVLVRVNSIHGSVPAHVVRDVTGEDWAQATCPHIDGEKLIEVRFAAGPSRGAYSVVAARHLQAA
jgi:hypothetical protein